jgi:hypothetical protein
MAGQEALGRVLDIIPIAAGKPFKMRNASGVMFVTTGSTSAPVLNERSSFGGSDTALPVIKTVYWSTATDGTAVWNKLILPAAVSTFTLGTTAGLTTALMCAFHVYTSHLSDPFNYLNLVGGGSGLNYAVLYDLTVQRGPAALEIKGS